MHQIIIKPNIARVLFLICTCFVTGCAFYPTASKQQYHANDCDMATRSLDLDYTEIAGNSCSGANNEGAAICLAALGIIIPVGSLVASGSIVLIGNTLHWLEYHGTCDEGFLWSYIEESK